MEKFGYLKSLNVEYIDEVFRLYLQDPGAVDESWRYLFEGVELGSEPHGGQGNGSVAPSGAALPAPSQNGALPAPAAGGALGSQISTEFPIVREAKVVDLIQAYRLRGHVLAHLNPLGTPPSEQGSLLALKNFGLTDADLEGRFRAARLLGMQDATLREILAGLKQIYCHHIGVEYSHLVDPELLGWLQERIEGSKNQTAYSVEERKRILLKLTEAESFEQFLHTRYIAAKRFSVEGGESIVAALDFLIEEAGARGASDVVLGMAHRGRLNVLTNIFGKKYEVVFSEFEGHYSKSAGEGDVKYHMGYSADVTTKAGHRVHLSLLSNPSHLEAVDPVVAGVARAKQDRRGDSERKTVVPVLIHGDAAFAGQGLIYETFQLSRLKGYTTGGTVHFVINNQVGFTTDPSDSRSTPYATDVAKMLESPVFHVNGDDPEAVVHVTKLAVEFVQKFNRDVVIDIICYRKYGHNEGDEPGFTQPLMYKLIKDHATPRKVYAESLASRGLLPLTEAEALVQQCQQRLIEAHGITKAQAPIPQVSVFEGAWKGLRSSQPEDFLTSPDTGVPEAKLKKIGEALVKVPGDFHLHSKLVKFNEERKKSIEEGRGINWGTAEALAFGSLLVEGIPVRLSGQDCERGTFTHRQSVFNDVENAKKFAPLNALEAGQASYQVFNSALSEQAVLGFEYGYSLAEPRALVIWEAQFGDFANGAQIIIDQFLSASESKWQRMSGLVLLLPHGYEGQGPEHSSARLERFLQLCGRYNMQVCNLTTPAQIFHALRRQVLRPFRLPLVVMSPKSLLRHPQAVSSLGDLVNGRFQEVLDDPAFSEGSTAVERVLMCSGKVYYDLLAERERRAAAGGARDTALLRLEQMYPFPTEMLRKKLASFGKAKDFVWVQEEPRNMGAWRNIMESLSEALPSGSKLKYAGRDVAAAPAVGSPKRHEQEQKALVEQSFSI